MWRSCGGLKCTGAEWRACCLCAGFNPWQLGGRRPGLNDVGVAVPAETGQLRPKAERSARARCVVIEHGGAAGVLRVWQDSCAV